MTNLDKDKTMPKILLVLCLICPLLATPGVVLPATPQANGPVLDRPEKTVDRNTLIGVTLEGTDSIGARLGTRLKERFNQSSLFTLHTEEEKDVPHLSLLLETKTEFAERPAVGSLYAVCWVFKQGKGYLGYLLAREMGTVSADSIDALVDKLVERTDGIAAKYRSLWK